ncbi:MAG: chlorohydrolase, partial [Chlamydiae bacterium]
MKNKFAITNGIIYTGKDIIKNHAIIINGKFIENIVHQNELDENIEQMSVDGRLIVPGFVNAHHHFYSALATGLSVPPCETFLDVLENLWWKLDNALTIDDVRLSARWTIAQCVKNGVTTVFDHHASYS